MRGSKKPPMHRWLSPKRVSSDQDRINAVGNVVVPLMAFYAMQILLQHA